MRSQRDGRVNVYGSNADNAAQQILSETPGRQRLFVCAEERTTLKHEPREKDGPGPQGKGLQVDRQGGLLLFYVARAGPPADGQKASTRGSIGPARLHEAPLPHGSIIPGARVEDTLDRLQLGPSVTMYS